MVKYIRTYEISLAANEEKTEVIKLEAPEGTTVKPTYIIITATGKARIKMWYDNDLRADFMTTKMPPDELGIKPEVEITPGHLFKVDVKDESGSANTVTIYLEYEKTTR
ncbi:MAG: hypothetical protein J7J51_05250 [Candidatus Omnitrophica bacterium]|nr:hypothetical protein [Candidatus Omnitrophota bacterium]